MPANWTKNRILFALKEAGTTAAAVAASAGLSRSTLYSAMERPYPRVHDLIAMAVGKTRHDIWPAYYGVDGHRLSRREEIRQRGEIDASARSAA